MDSAARPPDPHACDDAIVRSASLKFEEILDRLNGGGVLLDRALLGELASFLDHEAWPAVAANERLVNAAARAWDPAA